jgi:hypothetical protein
VSVTFFGSAEVSGTFFAGGNIALRTPSRERRGCQTPFLAETRSFVPLGAPLWLIFLPRERRGCQTPFSGRNTILRVPLCAGHPALVVNIFVVPKGGSLV